MYLSAVTLSSFTISMQSPKSWSAGTMPRFACPAQVGLPDVPSVRDHWFIPSRNSRGIKDLLPVIVMAMPNSPYQILPAHGPRALVGMWQGGVNRSLTMRARQRGRTQRAGWDQAAGSDTSSPASARSIRARVSSTP